MINNEFVCMLTADDVAELLNISKQSVVRYIKSGKIQGFVKIGGKWQISKDNFVKYCQGELNK